MTVVVPELELIELGDLDDAWDVPCCVQKPWGCGGDNAAVWIAHIADCCPIPKSVFYCTPCKDLMTGLPFIYCRLCDFQYVPASTAYKLIEPLNG